LEEQLEQRGPLTSSEVLRELEKLGSSETAARKRLQRAGSAVRRLRGHGLPNNQQLLYLADDWLSPRFKAALFDAWRSTHSAHANALALLPEDGTPCPVQQFRTRCGAPLSMTKQTSVETIIQHFQQLEIADVQTVPALGECVVRTKPSSGHRTAPERIRSTLLAERVVLATFHDWLRKLNLISYEAGTLRTQTDTAEFARFPFDLVAPSFARPLATYAGKLKPGFVLGDVWLDRELSMSAIGGFVRKTSVIRAHSMNRPFLGFLIADRFSKEAWMHGKKIGLIFTTPELLFGEQVSRAIQVLIQTLTNAANQASGDPNKVCDLFDALGRIEGAASNLRGPLFELIVGYSMNELEGGTVDIGKPIVTTTGERAEIDVLLRGRNSVRACECRGHVGSHVVSEADVKDWAEVRVPRWRSWILSTPDLRDTSLSFEYWTTGTFSAEALSYLAAKSAALKKYEIRRFDGEQVVGYVRNTKNKRLIQTLQEHYLKHPLQPLA
jgi:hypothetical protein